MRMKETMAVIVAATLSLTAFAASDDPVATASIKLARSIKENGLKRVGVLPWMFAEQMPNFSNSEPKLDSSALTRLYVDQMQNQLADHGGGQFRMIDAFVIADKLRGAGIEPAGFKPDSAALSKLPNLVDDGIDGLIVGTMRSRPINENSPYNVRDITWKLLDLKDPTAIVNAPSTTKAYSLAELVYDGRSQEFMRRKDGKLWDFCFTSRDSNSRKVPLSPRDSVQLHDVGDGRGMQLNPVFNPHCPFKVEFQVDDKPHSLIAPVDAGSSFNGQRYAIAVHEDEAYLQLDPGESWSLTIRNSSPDSVRFVVFVDGINVLGKKRELPDENCRAWKLKAGGKSIIQGWFSGEQGKEDLEKFVVTTYADSVAGKLGEKARVGSVTIVFFTEGAPTRNQLALPRRPYQINAEWDDAQRRIVVNDGMEPPPPPGTESAGGSLEQFAIGAKKPESHPLTYIDSKAPGAILAAMTIHYGSKADIQYFVSSNGIDWQNGLQAQLPLGTATTNARLVEVPTNGQMK